MDDPAYCASHDRWHSIPDLTKHITHIPNELESIRKGLQSGSFPQGDRPSLAAVWMDMRVRVLAEVRRDGPGALVLVELAPLVRKAINGIGRNKILFAGTIAAAVLVNIPC
jgi:hypothetical protein